MILRKRAHIRILFRGNDANQTRNISNAEYEQDAFQIMLRDGPAIVYGAAQTGLGAVLLLINVPILLDSSAEANSDPYTKFVLMLLLVAVCAIVWQVARNAKSVFESDEVQQKIHDKLAQVMDTGDDSESDQEKM